MDPRTGAGQGNSTRKGRRRQAPEAVCAAEPKRLRPTAATVWRESRDLIWAHRRRLAIGLVLMLVNRLASLVLYFGKDQ